MRMRRCNFDARGRGRTAAGPGCVSINFLTSGGDS